MHLKIDNMNNKFYYFHQNNTGGEFDKIGHGKYHNLAIEASSPDEANTIALTWGVYFDGCKNDIDCDCCGDRWSRVYDEYDTIELSECDKRDLVIKKPRS